MISITRKEADYLRQCELDEFVIVANKTHKSNHKSYYMVEDGVALRALEGLSKLNNKPNKK